MWREKLPDDATTDQYDRRHTTVEVREDAVDADTIDRMTAEAAETHAERDGVGQDALTDAEAERVAEKPDYTPQDRFAARRAKAIARDVGVDDWITPFDPTLTAGEQREIYEGFREDETGDRVDSEDEALSLLADAHRTAQAEECDHAEGHCRNGDPEACEFLIEECGYEPADVRELVSGDEFLDIDLETL